jgi:WD40 repeat protein
MGRPFHRVGLLVALGVASVAGVLLSFFVHSPFRRPRDPVPEAVVAELSGHRGPILACAFSADSDTLATGSADGTVRVWDASTSQLRRLLVGHSLDVQDVAFSPDGKRLVSASWDCSVRVWDTTTWQTLAVIDRRPQEALSLAFSPDRGSFAVAGGKGRGSVQAYESATCRLRWDGAGTAFDIRRLAYSPGGRRIITADDGGNATLWDAQTGRALGSLQVAPAHLFAVAQVAFGAGPSELVVRDIRGKISQWDLTTKRLVWEDRPEDGPYTGFAFSPDRKVFARMWRRHYPYGELQMLAGVRGGVLASVRCRNSYLASICYSPDGKYIATGGEWDAFVARIWDVERIMKSAD